jgi:quercetin dioxygenase-like cupin family protein
MKLEKNIRQQKQWIFNDGSLPIQMRIMIADEIQSVEHIHKTMVEYFYLIEGQMLISIEGNNHQLERGDLVVVEPGERHHIVRHSDDIQLLLLMPPPVPNDKVLV